MVTMQRSNGSISNSRINNKSIYSAGYELKFQKRLGRRESDLVAKIISNDNSKDHIAIRIILAMRPFDPAIIHY